MFFSPDCFSLQKENISKLRECLIVWGKNVKNIYGWIICSRSWNSCPIKRKKCIKLKLYKRTESNISTAHILTKHSNKQLKILAAAFSQYLPLINLKSKEEQTLLSDEKDFKQKSQGYWFLAQKCHRSHLGWQPFSTNSIMTSLLSENDISSIVPLPSVQHHNALGPTSQVLKVWRAFILWRLACSRSYMHLYLFGPHLQQHFW